MHNLRANKGDVLFEATSILRNGGLGNLQNCLGLPLGNLVVRFLFFQQRATTHIYIYMYIYVFRKGHGKVGRSWVLRVAA